MLWKLCILYACSCAISYLKLFCIHPLINRPYRHQAPLEYDQMWCRDHLAEPRLPLESWQQTRLWSHRCQKNRLSLHQTTPLLPRVPTMCPTYFGEIVAMYKNSDNNGIFYSNFKPESICIQYFHIYFEIWKWSNMIQLFLTAYDPFKILKNIYKAVQINFLPLSSKALCKTSAVETLDSQSLLT